MVQRSCPMIIHKSFIIIRISSDMNVKHFPVFIRNTCFYIPKFKYSTVYRKYMAFLCIIKLFHFTWYFIVHHIPKGDWWIKIETFMVFFLPALSKERLFLLCRITSKLTHPVGIRTLKSIPDADSVPRSLHFKYPCNKFSRPISIMGHTYWLYIKLSISWLCMKYLLPDV